MANLDIGKAPKNAAVLPFYGTAAFFFVLLTVTLFCSADKLTGSFFNFHLLSIVHMAVLGWGTMLIFGAGYQLLPVICEKDLFSEKLAFYSYLFLTAGIILLSGAFWRAAKVSFPLFGLIGGFFIFIAAILFFINVAKTTRICKNYSVQKSFVLSAAFWLLSTTFVGLLLATNLRYPFFSKNHLEILKLHAHAGLAGWFLQLIIGISSKLVPMFLLGRSSKTRLLKITHFLVNAGLISLLVDGYFFGIHDRALVYFGLVCAGIIFWLLYLRDVYRNRIKRPLDPTMQFTGLSFIHLVFALGCIPLLILLADSARWSMIYGVLAILGWITAIALGMTFKTLPFIVWNGHYKKLNGKGKIPMPRHLYKEKLLRYQWLLYIAAIYLLLIGLLLGQLLLIQAALALWILTGLAYSINVLIILMHKTKIPHDNTSK